MLLPPCAPRAPGPPEEPDVRVRSSGGQASPPGHDGSLLRAPCYTDNATTLTLVALTVLPEH